MAGPNLPVNIDTTYPDSLTDASQKIHQQHHDAIHAVVNFAIPDAAEKILYATPRGDDSNDGLTLAGAKLTLAAALTALGGSGTVQLGMGSFSTSASHGLSEGTKIVGAGPGLTTITYTGTGSLFANATPGTRIYHCRLIDLRLIGPGSGTTAIAIDLQDISIAVLDGLNILTFGTGIKHSSAVSGGSVYNDVVRSTINSCGIGVDFQATGSNGSRWRGVKFGACTTAVKIVDSNQNNFHACQFETNTTAVYIDSTAAGTADHNSFTNCRFESNTTAWNIVSANVRDTEILWPEIFGTLGTTTNNGTRGAILASYPTLAPVGAQRRTILRTSSTYSIDAGQDIVFVNASSAGATLPSAVTATTGRQYMVKNLHATALTVDSAGGTIDGLTTVALAQYQTLTVVSDGTNWRLTAADPPLPRTHKNPLTGWWHVSGYGSMAGDIGPLVNSAITDCVADGGGVVYIGPGDFTVSTTINLSSIHVNDFDATTGVSVTLKGAGKHQTYLRGGETNFGFMDLVGSNRITVEGMSLIPTGTVQYGILMGRKSGNGSSGEHQIRDVMTAGTFTKAAIISLSSEVNSLRDVTVKAYGGGGIWFIRDNTYSITAKHTALTTTSPYTGGNGQNKLDHCIVSSTATGATEYPLLVEYAQAFVADQMYMYASGPAVQIQMGKGCSGATFTGLQQEYSGTVPTGFYFSASGASPTLPDFRGVQITGSRIGNIYAEDTTRLTELRIEGVDFTRAGIQLDVATLLSSTVNVDSRVGSIAVLRYRVRTLSDGNQWSPNACAAGGLPSAPYRGIGARMYSTATTKPVWSDGTVWRDATGTAVGSSLLGQMGVTAYRAVGLRQLDTAATNCIKVRRSSDNATQDIGFSRGELDTASLLTFVGANSGYIDTFYDQSGNTRNLVQTTAAQQARIVNAGVLETINSRPSAYFSGSNRYVDTTNIGLYSAGAASCLVVQAAETTGFRTANTESGTNARYLPDLISSGYNSGYAIYDDAASAWVSGGNAKSYSSATLKQVSFTDSGTALSSWMDGAVNATTAYSRSGHTLTITRYVLGALDAVGTWSFIGHLSELAWFTSDIGTTARQAGEVNQKQYYATA